MGSSVGSLLGGAAGFAIGGPAGAQLGMGLGGAAGNLLGGSAQGGAAAGAQGNAGSSIYGAGQQAQGMAQFKPVGITNNFGTSTFGFDPYGQLTSAGYTLSPELQAIQNRVISQAGAYDPTQVAQAAQPLYGGASSLFNLGQQYLATSPQEAAAKAMAERQALLAPGRAAETAQLAAANYGRGTGGLGINTGTGGAPSNPLAQALYNARAKQDAELAAQADLLGQQRATYGGGLFTQGGGLLGQVPALTSAGYSPLTTQLGLASTTEAMGQQALDIGSSLGAKTSTAGANAGMLGLTGARSAAPYQIAQQSYSPLGQILGGSTQAGQFGQLGSQVGNWFGDIIGGGTGMGLLNRSSTSGDYMTNIGAYGSGPLSSGNAYTDLGIF